MDFIPTDEQWEKMKKHIKSDNYKKEDFFVFETLAVGDKVVPNRYMKLMPDLLDVMKEDAQKGVSLMLNHNWSQSGVQSIPIGKVFDARIAPGTQDGETEALYTTQYILRDDSKVDGYSKNDIIKLIETGTLADTSVGWGTTADQYKCSVCGNSIYDWKHCEHIPGNKYIVNEETNEVKQCIIEAHAPTEKHVGNNVLMENSVVFDGAYPNAIIQSAVGEEIETSNGKFKTLEGKEKLNSKDVVLGYSTAGGNINLLYRQAMKKGGLEEMNLEKEEKLENQNLDSVDTPLNAPEENKEEKMNKEVEVTVKEAKEENVENVENAEDTKEETTLSIDEAILNRFGNICENVEELVQMAKEGLSNRKATIEQALERGVHSMGNAFQKDLFAKTFANMQTKDIEAMGNAWESQAKEKFSEERVSKEKVEKDSNEFKRIGLEKYKTANY